MSSQATSESNVENKHGVTLAKKVYNRPDGRDSRSKVLLKLVRDGSQTRERTFTLNRLDPSPKKVVTLIRFLSPADVKSTGLLTIDKPNAETDQWIYLPAVKRSRKISSSRQGGRFVGTDFFFEDLRDRKVEEDYHFLKGVDKINEKKTYVLVSTPKDSSSSVYGKKALWIHPESLLPLKSILYDKSGKPWKSTEVHRMEKVQGIWTIMDTSMKDLKEGGYTRFIIDSIKYNLGLKESDFTKQALENP